MYEVGGTGEDKIEADDVFKDNMLAHIKANSNRLMRWLRNREAFKYYLAVCIGGGGAYWTKEKLDNRAC